MRVLVVYRSKGGNAVNSIIKNQGDSLVRSGIDVDYFPLEGKGMKGYLEGVSLLRKKVAEGLYDVVHAHYSLTAIIASMSGAKRLVASLMGSDVLYTTSLNLVIRLLLKTSIDSCIVKSEEMQRRIPGSIVIPNGVDTRFFKPAPREECRERLGWKSSGRHLLFAGNPERKEKNYPLFLAAAGKINSVETELHSLTNVPHELMPDYYNAADVVVLTSLWEGSPNVIKEAMACNRPIVSTDVGDVSMLLSDVGGCYIAGFDPAAVAEKISVALHFNGIVNGREKIIRSGLDADAVAERIISIYKTLLT